MPGPLGNANRPTQHRGAAINREHSLATPNNEHLFIRIVGMKADSALGQNDAAVHKA